MQNIELLRIKSLCIAQKLTGAVWSKNVSQQLLVIVAVRAT